MLALASLPIYVSQHAADRFSERITPLGFDAIRERVRQSRPLSGKTQRMFRSKRCKELLRLRQENGHNVRMDDEAVFILRLVDGERLVLLTVLDRASVLEPWKH